MFAIGSLTINSAYTLGMIKTKSIVFVSKRKVKSARKLNVKYKNIKIK